MVDSSIRTEMVLRIAILFGLFSHLLSYLTGNKNNNTTNLFILIINDDTKYNNHVKISWLTYGRTEWVMGRLHLIQEHNGLKFT